MSKITMPTKFCEIANNDLSKINGGASYGGSYTSGKWTKYNASECKKIHKKISDGASILSAILMLVPKGPAQVASNVISRLSGATAFKKGSKGNGLKTWYRNIPQSGPERKITYL